MGGLTDRLGLPVDPGIRDTVAALHLVGLGTSQSCEGHVNARGHGLPAPWVDLAGDDPEAEPRLRALLDAFRAWGPPAPPEARLLCEGGRLLAGGTFAALDAVRRRLAAGEVDEAERAGLTRLLTERQREMARFTRFLRARHSRGQGAPEVGTPRADAVGERWEETMTAERDPNSTPKPSQVEAVPDAGQPATPGGPAPDPDAAPKTSEVEATPRAARGGDPAAKGPASRPS